MEVYALGRHSHEAHLSGPGRREKFRDVATPGDSVGDGLELEDDGLLSFWLMCSVFNEPDPNPEIHEPPAWGFPFHEPCWEILCLAYPSDECVDIQALFDIFRSCPIQDGVLNYGHNYGGILQYERSPERAASGQELRLVGWEVPDFARFHPLEMSDICSFIEDDSLGRASGSAMRRRTYPRITKPDIFSKLPVEVLQYLFENLPTSDVLYLRQSSRTCANVPLSQSFWRSRFLPGREFEAIFEAFTEEASLRGRWEALYHLVKSIWQTSPFENRDRVWKLACSLRAILGQVTSSSLDGDSDPSQSLNWVDACATLTPSYKGFSEGSRAFHSRTLCVPFTPVRAFVSLVEFFERRYVSGIRFETADGISSVLGYQHPTSEVLLPMEQDARMAGFLLAQDERGFRGLKMIFTSGTLSRWAGHYEGIPVRRLVIDPITAAQPSVRHLQSDFDVSAIRPLHDRNGNIH